MTLMIAAIKKTPLSITLLATLLLVSQMTPAQDEPPKDQQQSRSQWYQIEVFIFAYEQPAQEAEAWPSDLGLKYPQRTISLQTAADNEELLNTALPSDQPGTGSTVMGDSDTIGSSAKLSSEAQFSPGQSSPEQPSPAQPSPEPNSSGTIPEPTAPEATAGPLTAQLEEQPFTLLPEEELQLSAIADKIARQGDIRKLFHAAWRQPIGPRDDSESILVRGGDPYDNHFELEGSINIGLERYLHISTDLWLSSFVSNIGGLQNPWPVLPPLPSASSHLSGQSMTLSFEDDPLLSLSGAIAPTANSSSPGSSVNTATTAPGLNFKALEFDNLFADLAIQKYSVERTVTMRQQRRMRSSELHYLDHPLMGLLVKIIPYELPEPESANEAQADSEESVTGDSQ